METIRNRMIHHGASVEIVDGVVRIRLNESFSYQSEVFEILKALRLAVKVSESHKVVNPQTGL